MARVIAPLAVMVVLSLLAFAGARGKAFNNPQVVTCAYALAGQSLPAADVLIIGSSRVGRGIDPGYMMTEIRKITGRDISIERMALTGPDVTPFRPLVERYLSRRDAPKHTLLQVIYNYKDWRQRSVDVPINPTRNVSMATVPELLALQREAKLNVQATLLPRTFEADYLSVPAMLMQKLEMNIYAGLRYIPLKLRGELDICSADVLPIQANKKWLFNNIDDSLPFAETEKQKLRLVRSANEAAAFIDMAPTAAYRAFENQQINALIARLQNAGSTVHLLLMPALGDTEISDAELEGLAEVFPGVDVIHPYGLFKTDIGLDLAKSFADTHHATTWGAGQFSRYFATIISGFEF